MSWVTSAPVSPSSRVRQAGTDPYNSTTGTPLSTWYSTWLSRMTCPADGSQVSVPSAGPRTVYETAYPKVASTGTCDDRSSRTTACVAGGAP